MIKEAYTTERAVGHPVSLSYLREHIYLPMSKMFALAWDNIYYQSYLPYRYKQFDDENTQQVEYKPLASVHMDDIKKSYDSAANAKEYNTSITV